MTFLSPSFSDWVIIFKQTFMAHFEQTRISGRQQIVLANSGETFPKYFQGCQSRDGSDKGMRDRKVRGKSINN